MPVFSSEFIHIGCDETFELGRGKSKELVARSSHADVYMGHLRRVAALPALQGKKLLFWGEIAVEHPDKLDLLPAAGIAVAWDYLPRENYDRFLKPYADRGIPTFIAPSPFTAVAFSRTILRISRISAISSAMDRSTVRKAC